MCGIIGIASNKPVSSAIINSLRKLEYRGYDSAGIATLSKGVLNEAKSEGRVDILEKNLTVKNMLGSIGIGHVRWATHGIPNTINAHPHSTENVSVVHNGIIENSTLLKKHLINKGHIFKSQTDTEVIVHLIAEYLKELNLKDAIIKTLKQLHGSFALGIIFKDQPDLIVGARRGSPLAVGYGPNENYLGSDSYALKSMTNKISYLNDGEFCIIKKDQVDFFDEEGLKVNKKVLELSSKEQDYDKGDFKHFMAKEIEEQPTTLKNCINEYINKINNGQMPFLEDGCEKLLPEEVKKKRILATNNLSEVKKSENKEIISINSIKDEEDFENFCRSSYEKIQIACDVLYITNDEDYNSFKMRCYAKLETDYLNSIDKTIH